MILPQLKVHWKKVSHAQLGQGRSQIFGSMSLFWMLDKHNWIPSYWSLLNNYVGNRAVDGGAEGSNEHCGQNINHKQQNGFLKLYSPIFIHKLSFPLFSSLHFFILDWLSIEEHAAFPPTFSHTIAGTLFCAQWSDPAFLILQKKIKSKLLHDYTQLMFFRSSHEVNRSNEQTSFLPPIIMTKGDNSEKTSQTNLFLNRTY